MDLSQKKGQVLKSLIVTLVFVLLGCGSDQKNTVLFKPGRLVETAQGRNGAVTVEVRFLEDRIGSVKILEEQETEGLGKPALEKMAERIVQDQSLSVDMISGATISSQAVLDAVQAAVEEAGVDPEALKKGPAGDLAGTDEEITTDIVIIGAGASGTAAALAASEKGASVVLLEKGDIPGGAGRFLAEGLFAVESRQQKEAGVSYSVDEAFSYLRKYTHYLNNGSLSRAILEESASTIDWLADYGTDTQLIRNTQVSHKEEPITYHKYVDKNRAFDNMLAVVEERGGSLYTSTTGEELLQDEKGQVVGILAKKRDGGQLRVHAQSVILASGGYAGSKEMLLEQMPVTNFTTMAYSNNVGDGLRMAEAVGADEFNLGTVAVHSALIPHQDPAIWQSSTGQLLNLPLMWINREGKRFVDEGVVYDFALWGNAAVAQGGEYYVVVDEATMKELQEQGSPLTNSFEETYLISAGVSSDLVTGTVPPMGDLYTSMEAAIGEQVAFKGETLKELAGELGLVPENLEAAAAQYNKAVEEQKDNLFLKDPQYLVYQVKEGPFYAVKAAALVEDSIGGIRVNSSLQVLTAKMEIIPGLFAVGCDAGGLFGDSYPVLEGLSLSFAYNSGRIAGYKAAALLQ